MTDEYCKCTRCRNVHAYTDRVWSESDSCGMKSLRCPRCEAQEYYRVGAPRPGKNTPARDGGEG